MNQEEEGADQEHLDLVEALAAVVIGKDENDDAPTGTGEENDETRNVTSDKSKGGFREYSSNDPLWWSPLEPEELGRGDNVGPPIPPEYLFTNEELAEALRNIDGEENSTKDTPLTTEETQYEEAGNTSNTWASNDDWAIENALLRDTLLGDLNFRDTDDNSDGDSQLLYDNSDGDSQLLLPLEDLDHIFDEEEYEAEFENEEPDKQQEDFLESQHILEQLQGLSLSLPPQLQDDTNDDSLTDIPPLQDIEPKPEQPRPPDFAETKIREAPDIPPYLYCQPCNDPSAVSTGIDFSDNFFSLNLDGAEHDPNYLTEIDNFLAQLSFPQEDCNEGTDAMNWTNQSGDEQDTEMPPSQPPIISHAVLAAAQQFLDTFGVKTTALSGTKSPEPPPASVIRENKGERRCLGHRERILNVQFSPNGTYMATASADSTIRVWRSSTNQLLSTLKHHNQKYECLRVAWASPLWLGDSSAADPQQQDQRALLATGGADGLVFVLKKKSDDSEEWETMACIDHGKAMRNFQPSDPTDRPQIYALQFVDHWQVVAGHDGNNRVLLTSSEDHVHVWELVQQPEPENAVCTISEITEKDESAENEDEKEEPKQYPWHFREVFSIGFGYLHSMGYGVSVGRVTEHADSHLPYTDTKLTHSCHNESARAFGGERNPNGVIFVFDAAYCPTNGLLGVALSDGTLRLLNGRGVCVSVLQLPGVSTHLTSFCWDATGTQLATSVAGTGHVITWEILLNDSKTDVRKTSCRAVLGGGHDKTVFGARYVGSTVGDGEDAETSDPLLLSWGSDGRVVLWDAKVADEVDFPLATLRNDPDYPIYGIDVHGRSGYIGMVGGSGDGGFIGIPALLYDVIPKLRQKASNPRTEEDAALALEDMKKPKLSEEEGTEEDVVSPVDDLMKSKPLEEDATKEAVSIPLPKKDP